MHVWGLILEYLIGDHPLYLERARFISTFLGSWACATAPAPAQEFEPGVYPPVGEVSPLLERVSGVPLEGPEFETRLGHSERPTI